METSNRDNMEDTRPDAPDAPIDPDAPVDAASAAPEAAPGANPTGTISDAAVRERTEAEVAAQDPAAAPADDQAKE